MEECWGKEKKLLLVKSWMEHKRHEDGTYFILDEVIEKEKIGKMLL